MGRAEFESDSSFSQHAVSAAAVLCRTEFGNLHMGLLYRGVDGNSQVLHLAWNDKLSRAWHWERMWASPEVPPERLRAVGALCRQIWRRYQEKQTFAYGFTYGGTTFNLSSGNIILGEGARGLTCATFVLAVFHSFGINLVDENDWPVRTSSDLKFLCWLEAQIGPEDPDVISALYEEVSAACVRITPDEVLGACACTDLPAAFSVTRAHADEIVHRLDSRATGA